MGGFWRKRRRNEEEGRLKAAKERDMLLQLETKTEEQVRIIQLRKQEEERLQAEMENMKKMADENKRRMDEERAKMDADRKRLEEEKERNEREKREREAEAARLKTKRTR